MRLRIFLVVGLASGLCASFAVSQGGAQVHNSKFSALQRPAAVSELELRLVEARLNRVESQVEGLPRLCCVRWYFDPIADKIKGRLNSVPDIWKSMSFDDMKHSLEEAALFSIEDAKEAIENGADKIKTSNTDYEIEFVALDKASGQFKIFATYSGGKIQLADKTLK